uniref:Uncharacterized protein n=1 Tax=Anguilla anguilla TaxID=7936 RepID=A0A0E9UCG9_ANGAN
MGVRSRTVSQYHRSELINLLAMVPLD